MVVFSHPFQSINIHILIFVEIGCYDLLLQLKLKNILGFFFSLKLHKKIHLFHKKSDQFLIIKVSEKWGVSRDGPKLAANESSEIRG